MRKVKTEEPPPRFRRRLGPSRAAALAFALLALTPPGLTTAFAQANRQGPQPGRRSRNYAQRVTLRIREARAVPFDEAVTGVTVTDPGLVTAQVKDGTVVTFTGNAEGETLVIVSGRSMRRALVVEVQARPVETPEQIAARTARQQRSLGQPSGTYTFSFSPVAGAGPSLLRQRIDYRRKLEGARMLRFDGEFFNFFGGGERELAHPVPNSFGVDRLSLGVDSTRYTLQFLDSEVNISPLTFSGYTLRGLHLGSGGTLEGPRALELFAGIARPSVTLFGGSGGLLGGALLPVVNRAAWRVRAGLFASAARADLLPGESGMVWHADGRYAPDPRTAAEGEVAYAKGETSWRLRLDLRRGPFELYGESLRLGARSPLVGAGAQSGGRRLDAFSVGWRPSSRFVAFFSANRAATALRSRTSEATLGSTSLNASASYNVTGRSRLGFRLTQQGVETGARGILSALKLDTRGAALTYNVALGRRWSNDFEVGYTASTEAGAGTQLERGLTLRDELRLTWEKGSATGYLDYTRNRPSLASLIVRNPQLLPPAYRRAFETDPVRFLVVNRDAIPGLLAGVNLPETRSTNVGARLQQELSRLSLAAEARYSTGEVLARQQRFLLGTLGVNFRLDAANSLQLSGARAFATNAGQSAFTLSFTHRFGNGSGGGFQFSRLLGLDRGRIEGRAFLDLNADGEDDPEEPGVPGVTVQLDGKRNVLTDGRGRFSFGSVSPGDYSVVLTSPDLGLRLRATTETQKAAALSARQTVKLSFGLTNSGFIAGSVFNDLYLTGKSDGKGAAGIRLSLRRDGSGDAPVSRTVDSDGLFEFRNLAPGDYVLEIDPLTLPPDFEVPKRTSWPLTVVSLRGVYLDIPIVAQRAISGIVFMDLDGDGRFDPGKDRPLPGARVSGGASGAFTDEAGSYTLRNLPAGRLELRAHAGGDELPLVFVELGAEPVLRRGVDFAIRPAGQAQP